MKKFVSLFLALVMVCSLSVSVFAAPRQSCSICGAVGTGLMSAVDINGNTKDCCSDCYDTYYCSDCDCVVLENEAHKSTCPQYVAPSSGNETVITYTGAGSEAYTITVPTTLQPGQSGTVKAEGTWATNRTLKVTTANTVTVANSIDGGEKVLDVTFAGIDQAGDNTTSILVSKSISVGDISNALFGTWTGVITYNVSMEDNGAAPAPTLISFTIDGTSYQAEEGMTWEEWVNSDYDTPGLWNVRPEGFVCGNTRIDLSSGYVADSSCKDVKSSDVIQANYAYLLGSFGGN